MTYNELFKKLALMTDEQRMQTVTVYHWDMDEFYPIESTDISKSTDVLDAGHFFMEVR